MKLLRTAIVLVACLLFLSSKQPNNLSGLWIGAYYFNPTHGFESSPLNWLIDVSDDTIYVTTLQIDGVRAPKRSMSLQYRRENNKIFVYSSERVDSIKIVSENSDSVVLQYHGEADTQFVFKKFVRGAAPTMSSLSGKSFLMLSGSYRDSISFLTDKVMVNIDPERIDGQRWSQTSAYGYSVLLLGEMGPPFFVKSFSNDTIVAENFYTKNKRLSLIKLSDNTLSLEGSWKEVRRLSDNSLRPPPRREKIKLKLRFDADSCEIQHGSRVMKRRWRLNSTSEILFFDPIFTYDNPDWAWYVKRDGNKLIVNQRTLHSVEPDVFDSERIVFKKQK